MYRKLILAATLLMALTLTACGGGGGKGEGSSSSSSSSSSLAFPLNVVIANARFLLFPNPQQQGFGGADQTNTQAYADAYYAAIVPSGHPRNTLAQWKLENGFGNSATGTEEVAVFGDQNDLGYGRRMTARRNNDGSLAFFVDNYLVDTGSSSGYTYSSLNVDAAVVQSSQRFVSTSAIEYSDINGTGVGPKFLKFYVFDTNGNRKTMVDQDGLGEKAMPEICVSCHGGRADPLTAAGLFPAVGNSISQQAGDTISKLQTLKVHTFGFSALTDPSTGSVRTRASQETAMKTINQWIHDTYPTRLPADNEWDGTVARDAIEAAYGGSGFPSATYLDSAAQNFVPTPPTLPVNLTADGWTQNGQATLYQNVVGPSCMTCHILRGTKNQPDLSFTTFIQFSDYADRIKAHVYDRGNMPLVKLIFNEFWKSSSTQPQTLAAVTSIAAQGATSSLKPGRPIADAGPDRFVQPGSLTLSAINSLYSSSFSWSIVTNPGGATFVSATTGTTATINFPASGTPYVIRLTASGNGLTSTKDINVLVSAGAPATPNFTTIQGVFTSAGCNTGGCHNGNNATLATAGHPPLSYRLVDYSGDANEFLNTVKGRINFTEVVASPLLRKPSGNHHGGGAAALAGFDATLAPGAVGRANYDLFVEWIMAGAPL